MKQRTAFYAALLAAAAAAACSSGSTGGPDMDGPTIQTVTQNRMFDPTGRTVDIRMSEAVKAAAANMTSTWTATGVNITAAALQADQRTVRLTLDALAIPGTATFGTVAPVQASGTVTFTSVPADSSTLTIGDGATTVTFEFATTAGGAAAGNVEVILGADAATTAMAFAAAVNAQTFYVGATPMGNSVGLENAGGGPDGNVAIAEVDSSNAMTIAGMAGGAGLEDLIGNDVTGTTTNLPLVSDDVIAPAGLTLAASGVEGSNNDTLAVRFSDDMIESEVENLNNWSFESPVGTPFDLMGGTVSYDETTRTATATFGDVTIGTGGANGNNLQAFDSARATFASMRDFGGNTVMGTAVSTTVGGDVEGPRILAVSADGIGTEATVHFSETAKARMFTDLGTGAGETRLILHDADATPAEAATGMVAFSSAVALNDVIQISDENNSVSFEFTDGGGASGGNTEVLRGLNATTAIGNLIVAINTSVLTITAAPGTGDATDLTHDTPGAAGMVVPVVITDAGGVMTVSSMAGSDDIALPVDPTALSWSSDGTSATVDFGTTVPDPMADSFEILGIEDLAGNFHFAQIDVPLTPVDSAVPAINSTSATAVAGENNDALVVEFDQPMSSFHILNPDNYTAQGLELEAASFSFDGLDTVTIDLDGPSGPNVQFGDNHDISIVFNAETPMTSLQGVAISGDTLATVGAGDNNPIALAGTSAFIGGAANPSRAFVVFAEAIDATAAETEANYLLSGSTIPVSATMVNPRAVSLDFSPATPAAAQSLTIEGGMLPDLGGTSGSQFMIALSAADTTGPTATVSADAVEGVGEDFFVVTFNESINLTGALNPANYSATLAGAAFSLAGSELSFDSTTNSVRFDLSNNANLRFGQMLDVNLSGMSDLAGNALSAQPAAVAVGGDSVAPGFASSTSAFLNTFADASGMTLDVQFSEDISETFVETTSNWTVIGGGATINSAVLRAGNTVRLTLSSPFLGQMLSMNGLPDLAGNTSGAITVTPIE